MWFDFGNGSDMTARSLGDGNTDRFACKQFINRFLEVLAIRFLATITNTGGKTELVIDASPILDHAVLIQHKHLWRTDCAECIGD